MQLIPLDYKENLIDHYHKFAKLPGFVLLHSADTNSGRYDILSAYPYDRIQITNQMELWSQLAQNLCQEESEWDLPFQGGAIGYISYDFGAYLHGIENAYQYPLVDLGLYDWAIIADHHLRKMYLFAANKHPNTKTLIQEMQLLWNASIDQCKTSSYSDNFSAAISKDKYVKSFHSIQEALYSGRCYQINYTQKYHASYSGDSWDLYKKISKTNPVPFAAFIRTDAMDILSFSPERFMYYEQGKVLTSPIKGTIKSSENAEEDRALQQKLIDCPKNKAENTMIVDLMRNDFGKIAKPGSVEVTNLCAVQSFNGLHHLVSDIQAECIDTITPMDAFLSCFPGGSITGTPKIEAMKLIQELEGQARGVYCGSMAYFSNHQRFDSSITIRTLIAKDGVLELAAGGGIVVDSDCEEEYQECSVKLAGILKGLSD